MEKIPSVHGTILYIQKLYFRQKKELFTANKLSPGQPSLLRFIKCNEGCSQKELATQCLIEQATATSSLTQLEKQNLIVRQSCQQDKRRMKLFLTDSGKEKAENVVQYFEHLDEKSLQGFTEEEKKELMKYLARMIQNLS